MSDDLVKRLRKIGDRVATPCPDNIKGCAVFHFRIETDPTCKEAANHIEELEAKLAKVMIALKFYADLETYEQNAEPPYQNGFCAIEFDEGKIARAALAEIEGETE
jgi:hypothetical protein